MTRIPYAIAVLAFAALVLAKYDADTGFTALIRFGASWHEKRLEILKGVPIQTVSGSDGYDGQFYAQIALDPTLRNPQLVSALDAPAYRARRILAPATAYAVGWGRPSAVLQSFALLNVVSWFLLGWFLHREIPLDIPSKRFARWFACLFSLGVLDSVRQSLVDLPALLLLTLTIRSFRCDNLPANTLWAALAHLAKETNVLASFALVAFRPLDARRVAAIALSIVPLAAWLGYVAHRFPEASETGLGNFAWPFLAAYDQLALSLSALTQGDWDGRHSFGLLALFGLYLQACILAFQRQPANPWWRVGVAYAVLLAFLGAWVWSGYWAACRATLPLTVAFNLLLRADRFFWPLWVAGNLTLLHGIWRFL